jgi:hypothetical protein
MRPWIIVASGAVVALAAAAALVRPELTSTPHAAFVPSLVPLLPTLGVTALAVYALCAVLLTSGDLIAGALRLRRHLDRNPPHHGPARPAWTAAFEGSGLQRLIPPPAAAQPRPAPVDGMVVLQGRFQPREARREVARLCYIGAARTHFFSALIVLAAGVVLGAAQQHGPLPIMPGPIPTVPAALALAGLVLLAILARIAVDVTAEPLVEMISRLPAEPTEAGLLRRASELLEIGITDNPAQAASSTATAPPVAERLATVLEQGHRALFDAIERLSTTTAGLATTTTSSIEALEAAFRATELRQQATVRNTAAETGAMADLRDAVSALTAVLESVRRGPGSASAETAADAGADSSRRDREPDLAQELHKLLQEIETAP